MGDEEIAMEEREDNQDDDNEGEQIFTPNSLAPDEHVKKMTIVVSDTMHGINIHQYFNRFWR